MVRLKFVPYALVALALVLGHVFLLSPAVRARAEATAMDEARAAAGAARAEALRVRAELLATGLSLRTLPELQGILAAAPATGVAVPTPGHRLDLLRGLARGGLPAELRGKLVLGLVSDEGTALARGNAAPTDAPRGVDLRVLAAAGTQGMVARVYDAPHLFVSFRLVPATGTLLVGLPLTAEGFAQLAVPGGALGAALVAEGEPQVVAGPLSAADAKALLGKVKVGAPQVVRRGAASVLGPLELPLAAGSDGAPLLVAHRVEVLPGLDGVGLVSLEPSMRALADYQRLALVAFLGMLGLTVVWLLLLGGGETVVEGAPAGLGEGGEPYLGEGAFGTVAPLPVGEAAQAPADVYQSGAHAAYQSGAHASPSGAHAAYQSGAHPAYQSGAHPAYQSGAHAAPVQGEALATGTTDSAASRAPWAAARPQSAEEGGSGRISRPISMDSGITSRPISMDSGITSRPMPMAPPPPAPAPAYAYEDNGDATRVATVPAELLRSAAAQMAGAAPRAAPPPPAPVAAAADPDEAHFQETFQEFMATRERCGEPADNLTYERFAAKLRKNREQLVQKYACRTVRFQVYVKEGKAALKATPIKD